MSRFEFQVKDVGGAAQVTMSGSIDEDVDFAKIVPAGANKLMVNLGKIKSINSCGIREWMRWIVSMTGQFREIQFVECPKVIVDQINMVQGFLPANGRVESFYVPFYSEESDEEKMILFVHGKEFSESGSIEVPEVRDSESNVMEMDVVEAKYFKFLTRPKA